MTRGRFTQVSLPTQVTSSTLVAAVQTISKQLKETQDKQEHEFAERVRSIGKTVQADIILKDIREANVVICDTTTRAIKVTLPAIKDCRNHWCHVKKLDSGPSTVTVIPRTGDIEQPGGGFGAQLIWNTPRWAYQLFCDGTHWYII